MIPTTLAALAMFSTPKLTEEVEVNLMSTDGFIVISNMILVIVTLIATVISIKELRRRAKDSDDAGQESEERLAKIVHAVIENEHEEDMAKIATDKTPKDQAHV